MLLEIKNLHVKSKGKEILKGLDLKIDEGEVRALLGPNASGKSSLSQVIAGNPKYEVVSGKILFQGKDITFLSPEERVKLGIALTWQSPPSIKGVKLSTLLDKISKTKNIRPKEFSSLLDREVNLDFSGGEKKISEVLQVLSLKPKLVVFDEIDSGMDIKRLEKTAKLIKEKLIKANVSILIITHWGEILNFLKPDHTNVLLNGKIICQEKNFKEVLKTIKKYGFARCKKCPFLADRS